MRRPIDFGVKGVTQSFGDKLRDFFRFLSPLGEYQLFVDIWEGQGDIDWSLLNVQMAAIRLNNISGGTHKDAKFDEYWSQCPILKVPYFVYNPWSGGQENFNWLVANAPVVGAVLVDLEVIRDGYSPDTYAYEFGIFCNLCISHGWNIAIYTAQWFLPYLSSWPSSVDYWWAQWPYQFYPDSSQNWEWGRVYTEFDVRGSIYPTNLSSVPGNLKFWQFTGDKLIFPGNNRVMDVNVAYGSLAELAAWAGGEVVEPPAPEPDFNEWIFRIKPENIVRAEVTGYASNKTVEFAAQEFHKTIQPGNHSMVINGDGWHTVGVPNGDWVVNGVWKHVQAKNSYSPRITFDIGQKGAIAGARGEYWYPEKITDYNAFGLTRRLVKEGAINPAYVDSGELNSRTTFGFTPDGTLVIYICDGWDRNSVTGEPPKGKTIKETGEILIANGVIEGGDGDGGGSFTLAVDGVVINDYNDDGVKVMRAVVNHLCLELNINPLDNGDGEMDFPVTVMPKAGAQAYSPDGARGWGDAPNVECTAIGTLDDKYTIDFPRWDNGKRWTVLQSQCTIVTVEPPPDPTPTPGEIPFEVSTGTTGYTAVIDSNDAGVVKGRFVPDA